MHPTIVTSSGVNTCSNFTVRAGLTSLLKLTDHPSSWSSIWFGEVLALGRDMGCCGRDNEEGRIDSEEATTDRLDWIESQAFALLSWDKPEFDERGKENLGLDEGETMTGPAVEDVARPTGTYFFKWVLQFTQMLFSMLCSAVYKHATNDKKHYKSVALYR